MQTYKITRKWYKKWWGVLLIIFLVVLVALILSFAFAVFERTQEIRRQGGVGQANLTQNEYLIQEYSPTIGPDTAPIKIVAFSDFECPFCKRGMPIVKQVADEYAGVVQLVYRHFPIQDIHPRAWAAAVASTCVAEQGDFWEYHDTIFENQDNLSQDNLYSWASQQQIDMDQFDSCYKNEKYAYQIRRDTSDGAELEIQGTPTFFINEHMVSGVISFENWKLIVDNYISSLQNRIINQ